MEEETKKISYEDFSKIELKIGQIVSADKIPETERLLKLLVNFGQKRKTVSNSNEQAVSVEAGEDVRQIVSGIAEHFPEPKDLIGRKFLFVANLESRKIRGFESDGMILALSGDGVFSLFEASGDVSNGTKAK